MRLVVQRPRARIIRACDDDQPIIPPPNTVTVDYDPDKPPLLWLDEAGSCLVRAVGFEWEGPDGEE
jgi:hypothetical protein